MGHACSMHNAKEMILLAILIMHCDNKHKFQTILPCIIINNKTSTNLENIASVATVIDESWPVLNPVPNHYV